MTRPRSQLISLKSTPYYHCISRCVRRAFLCGKDTYSGKNFEHRKPWLIKRLHSLAEVFSVDIAAYAVMSNHYHLVLHIDKSRSKSWSDTEVIRRWTTIFKGPAFLRNKHSKQQSSTAEQLEIKRLVRIWRKRLSSISWFMRCMNEYIARKANAEDECTGRFWEGRFKSQALLDESALLSCMTYVDLNPVRSGLTDKLEASDFTSIQERLRQSSAISRKARLKARLKTELRSTPRLMPFQDDQHIDQQFPTLPCKLNDYLELVEWTGRIVKPDKHRYPGKDIPLLVKALKLSPLHWQLLALEIQKKSISMLHGLDRVSAIKAKVSGSKAS